MEHTLLDRIAKAVGEFNAQLGNSTVGTLTQVWLPEPGEDGSVLLNTQGMPFSINGCGDLLALFRCISCKYKFSTDTTKPTMLGAVGRVYTTGEPEMSQNVQRYDQSVYPRVAEAQRCNVHGSMFLPIYDSPRRDATVAIMEVVQTQDNPVFPALIDWARCCLQAARLCTADVDKDNLPVGLRTVIPPEYEASAFESGVGAMPHGMLGGRQLASESDHGWGSSRGRGMLPPRVPLSAGAVPYGPAAVAVPSSTVLSDSVQVAPAAGGAAWAAQNVIKEIEADLMDGEQEGPSKYPKKVPQGVPGAAATGPSNGGVAAAASSPATLDANAQQALQAIMAQNNFPSQPGVVSNGGAASGGGPAANQASAQIVQVGNTLVLNTDTWAVRPTRSAGLPPQQLQRTVSRAGAGAGGSDSGSGQPPAKRQALSGAGARLPPTYVLQAFSQGIAQGANSQGKAPAASYGHGDRALTLDDLQPHFGKSLKDAAAALGICNTTLKRACRRLGLVRWPRRELKRMQAELAKHTDPSTDPQGQLVAGGVTGNGVAAVRTTIPDFSWGSGETLSESSGELPPELQGAGARRVPNGVNGGGNGSLTLPQPGAAQLRHPLASNLAAMAPLLSNGGAQVLMPNNNNPAPLLHDRVGLAVNGGGLGRQFSSPAVNAANGLSVSSYDGSGGMESLDILAAAEFEMSVGNAPPAPFTGYHVDGNFGLEFGGR